MRRRCAEAARAAGLLPALVASLLIPGADCSAAEDGAGAWLVAICASCHRLDGRNKGISSILRWEPEEIVDKLHDVRSDERASNAMRAVSLSLSDDEIAIVAAELGLLSKKSRPP